MKTLNQVEPRTPIHAFDLPLTITQPGSYYLAEHIATTGGGITIDTDNVTIDLKGFSLTGGTGHGISASVGDHKNLTVKNGAVANWSGNGIWLGTGGVASNAIVSHIHAEGNGGSGILVSVSSLVVACTAKENGLRGIQVDTGSMVRDSVAWDNGEIGIFIGTGGTVTGSTAYGNDADGIVASSAGSVIGCTANSNDVDGIVAGNGLVSDCSVRSNGRHGISSANDTTVVGNVSRDNGRLEAGAGIHADWRNRIERNHVLGNDTGILVVAEQNYVVRNTVGANGVNYSVPAGNFVGTIVASEAAMNGAMNDLVNIEF